jgi:hypothetical protein
MDCLICGCVVLVSSQRCILSANMLDLARVPGARRRLVRTLALLSLFAAPLAADNPGWAQQQILTASGGTAAAEFGASMMVDGNTAVIGAPS